MPRLVCASCEIPYRCHVGGVNVIETAGREQCPYRLWKADLYRCPGCAHEIVTAFGMGPFMEDHEPGFDKTLRRIMANGPFVMREFPAAVRSE